ncbi:MAG TPA: 50S ribosomal protein L25 [Candidatus Moranbacteria bacterium]|nr:50S ribosomal protein L25 [Candidatus Moranbacteria bacterium]
MEKITLESKPREERGRKTNKGRREGLVPAVIYGQGMEPESLWIDALALKRLLKKSGESVIINLVTDGGKGRNVIIHEMQKKAVDEKFLHVDFYQVNMSEKIDSEIKLEFIGESEAVKAFGGILVKSLDKVEVTCLPADLPSRIDVDISAIKTFDDHILVKDLKVSGKVEIKDDPETVVALVTPPRSEEELEQLSEKVEEDVTKVEGVVKPARAGEVPAEEEPKK